MHANWNLFCNFLTYHCALKFSLDSVKYFVAGPIPNGLKDVGQKEVSLSKQGEKL